MTHEKAPPIFDLPRFLQACETRGIDPAKELKAWAHEVGKLTPEHKAHIIARGSTVMALEGEEEEPPGPCKWCRLDDGTWDPWCSFTHRIICGYWGFQCVDFSDCGDPDPQPE